MILMGGKGDDTLTLTTSGDKTISYDMSGFETLKVGDTSGKLKVIGDNINDVSNIVITSDTAGDVKFYNMENSDLTIEAMNATQANTIETENTEIATLNYTTDKDTVGDS